jgi:hypothetical protein
MSRSIMQVSRATTEVPLAGKSADVAVGAAAVVLADEVTLDALATSARVQFCGAGDVRVRRDGVSPVAATTGELWFSGGFMDVNREEFGMLRMVADGSDAGAVHVTQMTGGRLR